MPRLASDITPPVWAIPATRAVASVRRLWARIQRERRLRATVATLHGLSDRALRDIGLAREDIEAEVRDRLHDR